MVSGHPTRIIEHLGGVAERSNAAVLIDAALHCRKAVDLAPARSEMDR